MKYFYDHVTDALSFMVSDFDGYHGTEELGTDVVVHVDARRQALAIDVRNASKVIDTAGLIPMDELPISWGEISDRLSSSDAGRRVLLNLHPHDAGIGVGR